MNIESMIENCGYPGDIKEYILETYRSNTELFKTELRKAENNSKRPGIKDKRYNLWIAANNTYLKGKGKIQPAYFECYYCRLNLNTIPPEDVRFEHFFPKLHVAGNIVLACKWCDEFKKDREPSEFESIILNEQCAKQDKYVKTNEAREKLIEFAPLVACHSMGNNSIWIEKMVTIAREKYGTDLSSIHPGQVRWRYYEMFRKKWYKK